MIVTPVRLQPDAAPVSLFSTHQRGLGVWFLPNERSVVGTAAIRLYAPDAEHVSVRAATGRADDHVALALSPEPGGYWYAETDLLRPGDTYWMLLDGQRLADPAALCLPQGVHGPAQAVDTSAFWWADKNWQNHPLADYILYELHVGTVTPTGTFDALIQKLDHLVALGVTALELMPVAQFPGGRNWGYDGVFPYAVQHSYGGVSGLQRLVNAAHERGLAVVLDVVYNHLGPEGNYLDRFGPYFTDRYATPWGRALNFDGPGSTGVRQFFIENVLMWLRDFHIDALRIDAGHAIYDYGPNHVLREMRQRVDDLSTETGRTYHLIVELDLNDPRYITPPDAGGFGMHAQWCDEFHHALRVAAGGERSSYYADYEGVTHLAKAYRDAYVYDGQFCNRKGKPFGKSVAEHPGEQFVVFSQNHDQIGNRPQGERPGTVFGYEMQKLMAGAVLVSPFVPMLFMGEEWGETNPFQYFVSHADPALVEAVREGRAREFAALQNNAPVPDPQADATFKRSKLQWHLLDETPHQALLAYYRALINFRKTHPALRSLNRKGVHVTANEAQQTVLLHRRCGDAQVVCLLNFSSEIQTATLPAQTAGWRKRIDSADVTWHGPGTDAPDYVTSEAAVPVPPRSIVVYSNS